MTRKLVSAGRPNSPPFPEQARELGRGLGLYPDEATILDNSPVDDGGGGSSDNWAPRNEAVRARIDPLSARAGVGMTRGDAISESSTHIVTFDQSVALSTENRINIEGGSQWAVTGLMERTDKLVWRAEVVRVSE